MLPPQMKDGVTVTGLDWQGRTFDIAIGAERTTVTQTAGLPFSVESPEGARTVSRGNAADPQDPAAGPRRDRQRRPLRAVASDIGGARPLRRGRRRRQPRDRMGARRRPGQPHRRSRAAHADRADRYRLERAAARVLPAPRLAGRRQLDGGHAAGAIGELPQPIVARYVRVEVQAASADRRTGIRELEVIRE